MAFFGVEMKQLGGMPLQYKHGPPRKELVVMEVSAGQTAIDDE
jgi:hypothetical protein